MLRTPTGFYRFAIVNPLTLIGKEIQSLLRERHIPASNITLLDSTGKEAGTLTEVNEEASVVQQISEIEVADADIIFFCGNAASNAAWIPHVRADALGIDLSQPTAMAMEGVAALAGVNTARFESENLLISPHPAAIPVALIADRLRRVGNLDLCAATVVEPASEEDEAGVDELFHQTVNVLNMTPFPKEIFDRQLAFNLYPDATASSDEEYVIAQIREVLGATLPIAVTLVRGSVFHGHSISLFVRFASDSNVETIASALDQSVSIEVAATDEPLGTLDAAGKDQILIGRIQKAADIPGAFWIWAISDNLRRASALNAVMLAEEAIARSGPPPS
ncbi:MAG: Asd/ArgC dimerization domain-containing protein [Thermoanaerobaculia bacterium]